MIGTRHYTKKQWTISIISIFVVLVAALILINNPPQSVTSAKDGRITESQYDQIKTGMSYNQIKQLIGSDGKNIFESGDKGTASYQISYMWLGENGGEATISFSGTDQLKVLMKSQSGLK
jgi:hypothetical protein